jgi:hypothetical protein
MIIGDPSESGTHLRVFLGEGPGRSFRGSRQGKRVALAVSRQAKQIGTELDGTVEPGEHPGVLGPAPLVMPDSTQGIDHGEVPSVGDDRHDDIEDRSVVLLLIGCLRQQVEEPRSQLGRTGFE